MPQYQHLRICIESLVLTVLHHCGWKLNNTLQEWVATPIQYDKVLTYLPVSMQRVSTGQLKTDKDTLKQDLENKDSISRDCYVRLFVVLVSLMRPKEFSHERIDRTGGANAYSKHLNKIDCYLLASMESIDQSGTFLCPFVHVIKSGL